MLSMGLQILGYTLASFGWLGGIVACALPMWRVSAFIGATIITSQIFWEGIWMTCVVQSTGQMQCKLYESMLALSPDLRAARALMVISSVVGAAGLGMAFVTSKCANCITEQSRKARASVAAGVVLIISGVLCLIPVSWTASLIVSNFYNSLIAESERRELGASLYIGWAAGLVLVIGGGLQFWCCLPKEKDAPSFEYQHVKSARDSPPPKTPADSPKTSISTHISKTYI